MFQSKKGLSDIVTNVLIILLVLVAVGIVWFFVQPFLRDSISGISVDPYTINLGVKARSVSDDGQFVTFKVERGAGKGTIVGFNVIITDLSDTNKVVRNNTILGEFETVTLAIDYVALGIGPNQVKYVSVVPIVTDSSGNEANGQQSNPEAPYSNTPGPGGNCTDGQTRACTISGVAGTETCVGTQWSGSCVCNNGATGGACMTGAGYPGTNTCNSGVVNCITSLSCGDGIKTTPPEVCEFNRSINFYGASCDYGALFGNPGALFGNQTCTSGCNINATCSCYADLDNDGFISGLDDDAFSNYFTTSDVLADCNHDGTVTAADNTCWNDLRNVYNICNYEVP